MVEIEVDFCNYQSQPLIAIAPDAIPTKSKSLNNYALNNYVKVKIVYLDRVQYLGYCTGCNYTIPTHINFYHFHFLTLTF